MGDWGPKGGQEAVCKTKEGGVGPSNGLFRSQNWL